MLQVGLRLWLRICWAGAGVDKMLLLAYSLRVPSLHSRILPREHSASPFLDHHEDLWSTNLTSYHCRSPPPSLDNQHLIPRSFFIQVIWWSWIHLCQARHVSFLATPQQSKVLEGQGSSHSKTGSKGNWTLRWDQSSTIGWILERDRDNESKVGLVSRIFKNSPLISEQCGCIMILRKRKFEVVVNFLSFTEKIEATRKELPYSL